MWHRVRYVRIALQDERPLDHHHAVEQPDAADERLAPAPRDTEEGHSACAFAHRVLAAYPGCWAAG